MRQTVQARAGVRMCQVTRIILFANVRPRCGSSGNSQFRVWLPARTRHGPDPQATHVPSTFVHPMIRSHLTTSWFSVVH